MEYTDDTAPDANDVWDKMAVRSYFKLLAIRTEGWDEAEHADSHYDAGEWSGPAWAKNWEQVVDKTVRDICERFELFPFQLEDWAENWQYQESENYVDAMMRQH